MKNKAQKQKDLDGLAEQFKSANAAMLVSFKNMTVAKDQELRRQLREAGVTYSVVKNTLARKASAGTPLEPMADQFKGVTAVALSANDPVGLSKAISKFTKANPDIFSFKVGLVEGKVVELREVESIASLPSRDDLLSKVLFLINARGGHGTSPRAKRSAGRITDFGIRIADFEFAIRKSLRAVLPCQWGGYGKRQA